MYQIKFYLTTTMPLTCSTSITVHCKYHQQCLLYDV